MQIFHALTWRRKTATAAAESRCPQSARVRHDEVEAVKLFLTGGDEVAAALGFEKLELEREVERSKRSEGGKEGYL